MKIKLLFPLIMLLLPVFCYAGGTETLPLTGTKTISLNGLYFAGSDGVNKSLTNPAGLIYTSNNSVEFSVLDRLAQSRFESEDRGLFKSFRNDEILIGGGVVWSLSDEFKTALAYQPAVNFNIEWPYANYFQGDSSSSLLVFDMYNRIKVDAISASAAFRFGTISIGVSPIAYRIKREAAFPQANPSWQSGTGEAAYQFAFNEEGWAYGFSFGAIAEVNSDLRLALSVRSAYSADIDGDASGNMFSALDSTAVSSTTVKSKVEYPWIIGAGAVYSIATGLNVNIDAQYSLWSSVKESIDQEFDNAAWQNGLANEDSFTGITGNSFKLGYRNTLDIGFGLEYKTDENTSYRFGYRYSQTPNQDDTYDMLNPSVDQHWLVLGFGLREESISLDAAVAYAIGVSKSISGRQGTMHNGSYGYNVVIPTITLKYFIL